MAKKATITPVTDTVNNAAAINTQLNAINNKLDNTLSLDGSVPNAMGADLDMNSNDLLNVKDLSMTGELSIDGVGLNNAFANAAASEAAAAVSATSASLSATQAAQYDGIWLDDVATLLADTTLTYTAGQPSTVVVGDYVRTRKEGFAYQVATSGDVTTAGGIQLDVMVGSNGYDVKAFGAVGDGVTDAAIPLQAALSALEGNGVGSLHIPAEKYYSSTALTLDLSLGDQVSITVDAGAQFIFAAGVNGLIVTIDENDRNNGGRLTVGPLTLATRGVPTDGVTALSVTSSRTAGSTGNGLVVNELYMRGEVTTQGWFKGIYCDEVNGVVLNHVIWLGKNGDKTSFPYTLTGANSPTEHKLIGCRAFFYNVAVTIGGTVEGVTIISPTFVAGLVGVDHATTAYEPLLSVTNGHINAVAAGIRTAFMNQSIITGNLFYQDQGVPAGYAGTAWIGVDISGGNQNHIQNNTFHGWNVLNERFGVIIAGGSGNTVSGNIYRGYSAGFPITRGLTIGSTGNTFEVETYVDCTVKYQVSAGNTAHGIGGVQYGGNLDLLAGSSPDFTYHLTTTGASNLPSGVSVAGNAVITQVFDANTAHQQLHALSGDRGAWVRRKGGGTWLAWQKSIVGTSTGWGAATGTGSRATFATSTVTTAELAGRVKSLIDDLTTRGIIGT